jgi:uncharacterized protein YndB with AHSA1/START domain
VIGLLAVEIYRTTHINPDYERDERDLHSRSATRRRIAMKMTYTMDIKAPVHKAFALVNDDTQMARWMDGLVGTEYLTPKDPANPVGARFRQRIKEGGRVQAYEGVVTQYEPNRLLGVRIGNQAFATDVTYRFEPTGQYCRLHYECQLTFHSGVAKFFGVLFAWFSRSILRKQMQKLKALAEQG